MAKFAHENLEGLEDYEFDDEEIAEPAAQFFELQNTEEMPEMRVARSSEVKSTGEQPRNFLQDMEVVGQEVAT